jgi:DNA (cytosine-5)-methyltransferase 1
MPLMLWFVKSKRAQSKDDDESWQRGGVTPTLNAFDMGDTRTTVIIFQAHMSGEVRIQNEVMHSLTAAMGTGGNNMPMACYPIQGSQIGRDDKNGPQGSGFGEEDGPMFTVNTTDRHAVASTSIVRRLTPIECERLQGFPDGWTEGQTDGHRYKQMGNAVAVPVVEWIMERLVEHDRV